jgi:FMN phosphatase YigB (HAD superfamily)
MPSTILPHDLATALDDAPATRVLSLDCFDTLLWRDCHAPADLFALLPRVTAHQRRRAEQSARKTRLVDAHGSGEVNLREIYAAALPTADAATIDAHVADEIAVEARHCFAFAPAVALMRAAKRRGMAVIVVSDTYLEPDQLAALIRRAAGDEAADLIDRIFCSCAYRAAKGEGLFATVLGELGVAADEMLHIGDNPFADLAAPTRLGIAARHLVQFDPVTVQRLRQEAAAGAIVAGGPAFLPHRAATALALPGIADPATALGQAVIGPVLTAFARWIADEAATFAAAGGGRVHPVFLMRDGHLPAAIFAALHADTTVHRVEISRFTATAASLRDAAAVRRVVIEEVGDDAVRPLLGQLLLTSDEAETLIATLPAERRGHALADALLSPSWSARIAARGRAFADRLVDHVRHVVGPAPGDTVMLIDLGYNGTVQNQVAPLLAERLGVHVAGRYLLLSEHAPSGLDKRGLIDARTHDATTLETFCGAVAVLEQLCTAAHGSVIDYADGRPIRKPAGIKGAQSDVRDRVQRGAVAYARTADAAIVRRVDPARADRDRIGAAAVLARFLFLPLPHELDLIAHFEHDVNLGTAETVPLFDPAVAARGLRERGLFYLRGARRMFLPAELRGQGLPTSLALLTQRRFGLDLRYADFCDRTIALPVLVADGRDAFMEVIEATPTHDGYFVAAIPIGACRYTVGVQFGRLFDWVQVDAVGVLPVTAFLAGEAARGGGGPVLPSAEGMEQVAPHLFRCQDADAFLMVPPPASNGEATPMMLTVVFRPIAAREPAAIAPASIGAGQDAHA